MLSKLRRRAEEEQGFTLIELLVVVLIIGILAAIAIPTFLNQRGKAYDANAKSQVRTAQTAAETYGTDNNGDFTSMTLAKLQAIEPTLSQAPPTLTVDAVNGTTGYTLSSTAATSGDKFTIVVASGVVTHSCTLGAGGGQPGGCSNGTW
jgi:type IV pilus assembly protein PilA